MKAVTVRNIPAGVAHLIQQVSKAKGLSINKTVVSLLEKSAGIRQKKKNKTIYHDLDALAGSWEKNAAKAFERTLAKQRGIDGSLWKNNASDA